jgi:hypothetical protein
VATTSNSDAETGKGSGVPACLLPARPPALLSLHLLRGAACLRTHLFMASLKVLLLAALWAAISSRFAWNSARRRW